MLSPQVLNDISAGTLANVVWVTPAETYSDHPSTTLNYGLGPSWVSSIVNAIGNSSHWPNAAIVVTWDDWGGSWDHIPPMAKDWGALGNTYIGGFRSTVGCDFRFHASDGGPQPTRFRLYSPLCRIKLFAKPYRA
jgi:phospholipase C